MMSKPQFQHNCDACVFLGQFYGLDVWICETGDSLSPSIVCRHGNEGHEYSSSPLRHCIDAFLSGATDHDEFFSRALSFEQAFWCGAMAYLRRKIQRSNTVCKLAADVLDGMVDAIEDE